MITLRTALIIQNRDILCDAGGPDKNGKYSGWILIDEQRWSPLISTPAIYETREQAVKEMEALVVKIRETDLTTHKEQLTNIIGEAAPIVDKIVQAAQKR